MRRDKHTLRTILIVAAVVIVVAAVAGVLLALRGHGHGHTLANQSNPGTSGGSTTAHDPRTPAAAAAGVASNGPLPSGWTWYTASASSMGTSAGFKLAIPDGWQPSQESSGRGYVFEAPGGDTFLQIDLTPHTFPNMVKEAHYLALEAPKQGKFPGYGNQEIRATPVRGQVGASWSFTWQDSKAGQIRSLDLMYIAPTGNQSYALYMTSPAAAFSSYLRTFTEEMRTFRAVP
jgi:hypothetical protein